MRRRFRDFPPALWSVTAIVASGCAFAWPMQGPTLGENSNYALTRSLVSGTARIDRTRFEVGDLTAGDFRTYRGHVYSDKAPGLAFVTVPAYVALRALGMRTSGDPTRALWALRLWSIVLPTVLLLLIVRSLAEGIAPGYGAATAVVLGAATLILPLTTLFLSHALTALLVLAPFALLWREREGKPRMSLLFAAGLLAGFAFTTEYPTALAALVLGLYALLRAPRIRRAAVYGAGVLVGVAPLLAYNRWAFGSVTHLSYFGNEYATQKLTTRLDPSLINGLFTFFAMPGLFVLAPVLGCGIVGLVLLYRRGQRAEALVIGLVLGLFTLYNASLPGIEYDAFTAGPRYLIPVLPLMVLPAALTFRKWPLTTAALGLVSAILMSVMTASSVHSSVDPRWFHRLAERIFPSTAASVVGITGWYAIAGFFVAIACAIACAAVAARGARLSNRDAAAAGLAVLTWAAAAAFAPNELTGRAATYSAYVPVLVIVVVFAATIVAFERLPRRALPFGFADSPRARRLVSPGSEGER